ncbi:MAG: hypothetical protein EAZ57_06850 [Cytophagales bacterium]|nr:MAG: hypothetical protein EAZ67_07685 [Cytophagales bacterium]TAF60576.1 MAG: hypothetical protein EAZ57_06850 [Cytophagales bacterium]
MKQLYSLLVVFLSFTASLYAQLNDSFTDGNYTASPTWVGGSTVGPAEGFTVNPSLQLQTNLANIGTGTRFAYLTTPTAINLSTNHYEWSCNTQLLFTTPSPPNSTNHSRIYLTSDASNLLGALNGYFIKVQDKITLNRQDGLVETELALVGGTSTPLASPVTASIRVIRTMSGLWQVFLGGVLQGVATDLTYTTSSFFGVQYRYSASTRRNDFVFDNALIQPYIDVAPPVPTSVQGAATNQIAVNFNEPINEISAENASNYLVVGIGAPLIAELNPLNPTQVILTFATTFVPATAYTLNVSNVKDLFGNDMVGTTALPFVFNDLLPPMLSRLKVISANALDVFFNEDVQVLSAETEANYSKSLGIANPAIALRDAANFKLVHLTFPDNFPANTNQNLSIINVRDLASNPISPAISGLFRYDTDRPDVCPSGCVIALSPNQVRVIFDEDVDLTTSQIVNNYEVLGLGFPTSAVRDVSNPKQVLLTFPFSFVVEQMYQLKIQSVTDLVGNEMTTRTRDFMYDNNNPTVVKLRVLDNNNIELTFSEFVQNPSATLLTNYLVSSGIGNPTAATLSAFDARIVTLTFAGGLGDFAALTLTVSNVRDLLGNAMSPPQVLNFGTRSPSIGKIWVLSRQKIRVQFSEPIETLTAETEANYNVPSLGVPSLATKTAPNLVELDFAASMAISTPYTLSVLNVQDLLGNAITTASTETFSYQVRITQVKVVSANLLDVFFSSNVVLADAEDELKYSVAPTLGNPASAVRDASNFALVHLSFGPNFLPSVTYTLTAGWCALLNGQIAPISTHSFVYDNVPPSVTTLELIGPKSLRLTFSEELDEVTAEALNHYAVNFGIGLPVSVVLSSNKKVVVLTYASNFAFGTVYTLTVKSVRDLLLNEMGVQNLTFSRPVQPAPGELLITEIFADESPKKGLPLAEFIEIYNPTTTPKNLLGVLLQDGSSQTTLPSYTLAPGAYVTLCPLSAVDSFSVFGACLGLPSWLSLTNSGEPIRFLSSDSVLITSVTFDDDWYKDDVKKLGGWSLERIDLSSPCAGGGNWLASRDSTGGTPSKINSVNGLTADAIAPFILASKTLVPDRLELSLSEESDSLSMVTLANYSILDGSLSVASIAYNSPTKLTLRFATALDPNKLYTLVMRNVRDCIGNTQPDTINFGVGEVPKAFDLIITEIMADESPRVGLPLAEYIEIRNRTSKLLNLGTVRLSDATSSVLLPSRVLEGGAYLLLTGTSKVDSFGISNAVGVVGFPSLSNTGEPLTLRDTSGKQIFAINFDDGWYGDAVKKNGGWSLEMIDQNNPCGEADNWLASKDVKGGTPGKINSVSASKPDLTKPAIASLEIITLSQLEVTFSETLDSLSMVTAANYAVAGLSITSVVYVSPKSARINFSAPIKETLLYKLTVTGAKDCAGNASASSKNFGKGRIPLANELVITEIMADETPKVGLPLAEYLEIYNPTPDLISLQDVVIQDATSEYKLPNSAIEGKKYLLLCSTSKIDSFATVNALAMSSFPSLTNSGEELSLINSLGKRIFSVNYSDDWYKDPVKALGGWSLEMIDPSNFCGEADNWLASKNPLGGTPAAENSVLASNPDTVAPAISSITLLADTLLRINFSEKMDSLDVLNAARYTLNKGLTIKVLRWLDATSITLSFSPKIATSTIYELSAKGLRDCSGNASAAQTFSFGRGVAPTGNELLITEILADPSPRIGLPEREFLEIHNNSDKLLEIGGVTLSDAGGVCTLPPAVLLPRQYAVICGTSSVSNFAAYGTVIGVTGFPSLDNEGEKLTLRAANNNLLFSVDYDYNWYSDPAKKAGGWTLELKDLNSPCIEAGNWLASESPSGGTPAAANSLSGEVRDVLPPQIEQVLALSDTLIEVRFSEKMDSVSLMNSLNYLLSDALVLKKIIYLSEKNIRFVISPKLLINKAYKLTVKAVRDCSGNAIEEIAWPFGLGVVPDFNELIITEIMCDPSPVIKLPETEYLEIFNPTNKILSLGGVLLSDGSETVVLPFQNIQPQSYWVICPSSSVNALSLFGSNILGISNWVSLDNFGENLRLRTPDGRLIHDVTYSDDWYNSADKEEGGWSLEMIDPNNPCAGSSNWTASEHPKGGTPAKENSVLGSFPDNRPPKLLKADALDPLTVRLKFDEKLDSAQLVRFAEISLDKGLIVKNLELEPADFSLVKLRLVSDMTPRTVYTAKVGQITDCVGNLLNAENNQATFVLPEQGDSTDLVINEILFDPPVGGTDFVEIYNRSEKFVNLRGWRITGFRDGAIYTPKIISEEDLILAPQSYLAVSRSNELLLGQYPNGKRENFWAINSLPSFADSEGTVILQSNTGQIVDRFDYNKDFHLDLIRDREGVSLERINFNNPTNDRNNWHSAAATIGYGTPGYLNSQYVGENGASQNKDCFGLSLDIFTPDNDGIDDFVQINYTCADLGTIADINIYDMKGRLMRQLVQNRLVATSGGSLTWDGLTDSGQKVPVGYYLITIQTYNLSGKTSVVRKKIAVSGTWNR